jgi:hypothetical protein
MLLVNQSLTICLRAETADLAATKLGRSAFPGMAEVWGAGNIAGMCIGFRVRYRYCR